MESNEELVASLQNSILKTPLLVEAFLATDRAAFVPERLRTEAYEDYPLPIESGQTISQPYTVAFMLELLQPQPGQRILDVGSGSGWTTALLAYCVGDHGRVIGVEIAPELIARSAEALRRQGIANAEIREAGPVLGVPHEAPYDRILVSAAADAVPTALVRQLKPNGILVMPVKQAVVRITKQADGAIQEERHEGFAFVPLISP